MSTKLKASFRRRVIVSSAADGYSAQSASPVAPLRAALWAFFAAARRSQQSRRAADQHYPIHRRVCRLRSIRTRIPILSSGRSHTFLALIGEELAQASVG